MSVLSSIRSSIRSAVVRGARFLDEYDPEWWKNNETPNGINLDKLDLSNECRCILGQRYDNDRGVYQNGYRYAKEKYILYGEAPAHFGFNIKTNAYLISTVNSTVKLYSMLTEAWIEIITARRHPRRKYSSWLKHVRKAKPTKAEQ